MQDLYLTEIEQHSAVWQKILIYVREQIVNEQKNLEGDLPHDKTQTIRGMLKVLRKFERVKVPESPEPMLLRL